MEMINAPGAPAAVGPYSHAVKSGPFLFMSGQLGIDPEAKKLVDGGIEAQTTQVFKNITAVLTASDLSLSNVVKCTVFVKNLADFATVNALYEKAFGSHKPARSTVEVARLPLDGLIEIECIAELK